jgi:2-phospho-L-lactate guanylyltransferase
MNLWTVIPCRGLQSGKSRLSSVLDDTERRALNEWLLRHVLGAVAESQGGPQHCIVVSPSEDALELAESLGAHVLDEPERAGLNQALGLAAGFATARGAERLLVLSSDLPYLTREAVDAFLAVATRGQWIVLAGDHTTSGTNGIVLDVPSRFRFRFGEGSLVAHREEAIRIGAAVVVHREDPLAYDLDTPEDLARWHATLPQS